MQNVEADPTFSISNGRIYRNVHIKLTDKDVIKRFESWEREREMRERAQRYFDDLEPFESSTPEPFISLEATKRLEAEFFGNANENEN